MTWHHEGTGGSSVTAGHAFKTREGEPMATEKHRGAPKKQVKKQSAASKAKQAKKQAARTGAAQPAAEQS